MSGSLGHGGIDLFQEAQVRLPTTAAAISRLGHDFIEAAVAVCDAGLAAVGGRGSPGADDEDAVPSLCVETQARGLLGTSVYRVGGERERRRGLDMMRAAVALLRLVVRKATPGSRIVEENGMLAGELVSLAAFLNNEVTGGMLVNAVSRLSSGAVSEAEACLREALELSAHTPDVGLQQGALTNLINMSGSPHHAVGPAEAETFRLQLNKLHVQTGRNPDTTCGEHSCCTPPHEHSKLHRDTLAHPPPLLVPPTQRFALKL